MTPHRLRRAALQRTRKRSQRDPQDFYRGLLDDDDQSIHAHLERPIVCRHDEVDGK